MMGVGFEDCVFGGLGLQVLSRYLGPGPHILYRSYQYPRKSNKVEDQLTFKSHVSLTMSAVE
jgi:hypothetical protein